MSIEMQKVADYIVSKISALQKDVLTIEDAAAFTGLSRSHIYKLTSSGDIPHYKPNGKYIYFDRKELEAWLLRNRVSTNEEIRGKAEAYCLGGQRV